MNGLPRGVPDTPEILGNPEIKNKLMIHAEMNVLSRARGVTVYVYPCLPCTICMGLLIQRGIKRVVVPKECQGDDATKWDPGIAQDIAEQAGVEINFI
jgi:dCMP deaminase